MNRCFHLALASLALSALVPAVFAQEEIQAKSPISSIALFKNGLGVVTRTLNVDKPGLYVLEEPMRPVHGTFWFSTRQDISVSGETRKLDKPNSKPFANIQDSLLGHAATFKVVEGSSVATVKGKVVEAVPASSKKAWDRNYARPPYAGDLASAYGECPPQESFVSVQQDNGSIAMLRASSIVSFESDGINKQVKEECPVFIFNVKKKPEGPIAYTYLSKGISWAPSYLMRLNDASNMTLALSADIRNELEDFQNADISLISGCPNIPLANVTSLLCANTTWASFFQQGEQAMAGGSPIIANQAMMFQRNGAIQDACGSAAPGLAAQSGESADIVLTPIGKLSLKEGGSTWFELVSAKADYERIVDCLIPDHIFQGDAENRRQDRQEPQIWDSIRFKNPFKFPMTTAPIEIADNAGFLGQCIGNWANPGAETTIHVTKALSVVAKSEEQELNVQRIVAYVGIQSFFKTVIQGSLSIKNYRATPVKMVVKLQFSGDLVSAEGSPKCTLRNEGIYSVNKRNELAWEVSAKPNEEFTLKYSYSVLINR